MRPSSIFSSETLRLRGYRPKALLATVLLVGLFELGVARRAELWIRVPNTPTGLIGVQDRIASLMESPEVIVLGNSRMIDAVLPEPFDQRLGLPEQSTYNLSIQAARPFDYLSFYRRNRERLAGVGLVILGLDDQMLSQEMDSSEQRFRLQADLGERRSYQGRKRLSFTAGWFFRSLDVGAPATSMLRTVARGGSRVELAPDLRIVWTRRAERGPEAMPVAELDRVVHLYYSEWELSPSQIDYLAELIDALLEDGKRVLMVRPPVRDEFRDRVLELEPERFARAAEAYRRLPVEPLLFDRAGELAMEPWHFIDYGHLSESGSLLFTEILAERVAGAYPELFGGR